MSTEIGRAAVARVTVTGPARRTQFALRIPARIDRFGDRDVREPVLLQLPVGGLAAPGLDPRAPGPRGRAAGRRGRLRRAHVASAPRRPRGPAGRDPRSSAAGEASAASLTGFGLRSPPHSRRASPASGVPCCSGSCSGRTKGSTRTCGTRSGPRALPPARGLGPERRARRWRRAARRMAARHPADGGAGRGARGDRRVRARRRRAAVGDTRRGGGRPRIPRVDVCPRAGSLVVPAPRRARAARVEPVQPARRRLPALVRRRRRDLHARAPPDALARGISAAACGGGRRRRVDRLRRRHRADPPLPVRLGARVLRGRQRDGGACRRAAARARPARGSCSTQSSRDVARCSCGWTAGSRRISCSVRGRSPRSRTRSSRLRPYADHSGAGGRHRLGRRSRTLAVAFARAGLVAIAWRAAPDPSLPPPTGCA